MKADIKIGFLCNNRCKFCVQGEKRKIFGNKSRKIVENELCSARKTCLEVVFTGGEPTLHKNFIDLVSFAKKLKFNIIQIQTNGRLFCYEGFCIDTINAGANVFSPALHGNVPKIHDFLTAAEGSFSQTVEGIKNLKKLGQYIVTNTVITKMNYKFLPRIASLLVDLGVDQFQFAFPHILGAAAENKLWLVPRKSEITDYLKKGLDIGARAGKKVMVEALPYCLLGGGYEKFCAERMIPETKIFDAGFVIESFKTHRLQEGKIKSPSCKKCKYYSLCEGPWKEYPEIFGWSEFKSVRR